MDPGLRRMDFIGCPVIVAGIRLLRYTSALRRPDAFPAGVTVIAKS